MTNSIVYGNTSLRTADHNWSGGSFAFSCTTPLPSGTGNTASDPLFAGAATNNYRLQVSPTLSPCIDKGTNLAWMATGTDLDGLPRLQNKLVDMGCYEASVAPQVTVFTFR